MPKAGETDLDKQKEGETKKQIPSKQVQQNVTSKTRQLVDYRADLLKLRTAYKLKCHTSLREKMTKQLLLKDRRIKPRKSPGETMKELLLICEHQVWMLEE
jgi:hypothetical protein